MQQQFEATVTLTESVECFSSMNSQTKKLTQLSFTANIFTTYESMISGYVAAIIGHLFFKTSSEMVAVILGFVVFASSFLIRPLGGMCWGYWGDKYGAGKTTKYAMILTAIPACLISILPTYATIGYLATFLLIFLRLMQGFCSSGQTATNFCYVYEQALDTKHSGWFCGLGACGGWAGSLLASSVAYILYAAFSDSTINSWAWRIPFLLCVPMSIILFNLRKSIAISSANNAFQSKQPILQWLNSKFILAFTKSLILLSFMEISFNMLFVWLPTYLSTFLGMSHSYAILSNVISLVAAVICVAFFGYLAKFISYKTILLTSLVTLILFSYPLYFLLHNATFTMAIIIQLLFVVFYTPIEGNYIYAIGKAFSHETRNKGVAMSWTLSGALCGGTTPLICSYYIHTFNLTTFPILYLIIFGIITIPAVCFL